jgi:hypothetical protein
MNLLGGTIGETNHPPFGADSVMVEGPDAGTPSSVTVEGGEDRRIVSVSCVKWNSNVCR